MSTIRYFQIDPPAAFRSANAFLDLTNMRGDEFVHAYLETFWRMSQPPRKWMNVLKYGMHARDLIC